MTPSEEKELLQMVREIHSHLGLDCRKVVSMKTVSEKAKKDVLKWQEKQLKRDHEREATAQGSMADRYTDGAKKALP